MHTASPFWIAQQKTSRYTPTRRRDTACSATGAGAVQPNAVVSLLRQRLNCRSQPGAATQGGRSCGTVGWQRGTQRRRRPCERNKGLEQRVEETECRKGLNHDFLNS